MARIARVIVPDIPHHITQRGNRRQTTFFEDSDYREYVDLLSEWCATCRVEIWTYCLMPNHVHLIAVPSSEDGLRRALGETHRRYTRLINFREGWRGHLWQGRFASFPMDEKYLLTAARYVELNPVRAKLVENPEDYRWSSALAHVTGNDDELVRVKPLLEMVDNWKEFLANTVTNSELEEMRHHENTGRPLGGENFIKKIERFLGRFLGFKKPGPKPKVKAN
jgi:putative transposase